MNDSEKTLNRFATRVRQLLMQYGQAMEENAGLKAAVEERDRRIDGLEERLKDAIHDYQSLKTARMIEVTDGDVEAARKRVAKLIRDVEKCITLLGGNEEAL